MNNQRINVRTGSDDAEASILKWLERLNLYGHFQTVLSVWQLFQRPDRFLFEISDLQWNRDGTSNLKVFTRANDIIVHHTDIARPNKFTRAPFHTENDVEAALLRAISTTSGIREQKFVEAIREGVMQRWREIQIDVALEYDEGAGKIVMTGGGRTKRITVD